MSEAIKPFATVRVKQLIQSPGEYDGWKINNRPPQVGDVGTVVEVLVAQGYPNKYVVEKSGTDGTTTWLAEFIEDELEPSGSFPL